MAWFIIKDFIGLLKDRVAAQSKTGTKYPGSCSTIKLFSWDYLPPAFIFLIPP